jgi:long-chain acyl-CoA synthetase
VLRVTPLAALASGPQVLAGDRRRQRTPGRVQQVKRYRLLPAAWTAETEELTLKRRVVHAKYADIIETLYAAKDAAV